MMSGFSPARSHPADSTLLDGRGGVSAIIFPRKHHNFILIFGCRKDLPVPLGLVIVCQMSCFAITFSSDLPTVYYRPYQEDGAIESRSPAYSNDRSIGRILSKAVTPPHTAASLKSHLCKIEGFPGSENAHLYSSLLSQTILDNSSRLALMNRYGPGSSEKEPIVLLIKNAEKRSIGGPQTPAGLPENPLANKNNYGRVSLASLDVHDRLITF